MATTGRRHLHLGETTRLLRPALVILAVQLLLLPMPLGVWIQGVTVGLLGALVAVGMALIYRANHTLNFAQGDLGVAPAMLTVILIQSFAWNYFLGLGIGVVAAFVLGGLAELAVIRRFFRAPRLILTVATIGLAQLLTVVTFLLPRWLAALTGRDESDVAATGEDIDFPWAMRIPVEPLIFNADYVVAWAVAPLALLAVALFLRYTDLGVALRGSAERSDRAFLLGVPVKRLHTWVWAIAGLLSFVGLFLRAGIVGLPFGSAFTLTVLLLALAALTLGRLTELPTITASAIALGVLEQGVEWNDEISFGLFSLDANRAVLTTPVVGLVIVAALVVQRAGASRTEQDASGRVSSWQNIDDIRPVPVALRAVPIVWVARGGLLVVGAATLLMLPHLLSSRHSLLASMVMIYALITLSIVVLTGWAGQVSLGQMGFVGVGGAVAAVATGDWGLDLTVALVLAGLAGALVAALVGIPVLRLRGLYLGVVTLAFGLATTSYLLNPDFFSWVPVGRIERPPLFGQWHLDSPTRIYYVCLGGLAIVVFLIQGIRRSRTGRVLVALRENERAIQSYGVSLLRTKLTAFAISGFVAAIAGGLMVHHQQSFSLSLLGAGQNGVVDTNQNLMVFTAAVVGGLGSPLGAVLGALFLQGGRWFLPGEFTLLSTSVGVLLVLLLTPGGLGGLVFRGRDLWLGWVAQRQGLAPPGVQAAISPVETTPDDAAAAGTADPVRQDTVTPRPVQEPATEERVS